MLFGINLRKTEEIKSFYWKKNNLYANKTELLLGSTKEKRPLVMK